MDHKYVRTSIVCIDETQPERAMAGSEVAVDRIFVWSTDQTIAFRFRDRRQNKKQHAEFTEDLRDDGVMAWCLGAEVTDAPTETNWTPLFARWVSNSSEDRQGDADGGGSRYCAVQVAGSVHLG